MVPGAGLEPARRLSASADFKSAVSTSFTTRAGLLFYRVLLRPAQVFVAGGAIAVPSRLPKKSRARGAAKKTFKIRSTTFAALRPSSDDSMQLLQSSTPQSERDRQQTDPQ